MGIGDQDGPELIDLVDWHDLYNHTDNEEAVIADLAFRGRWTALASPAKAGKSTILLALAVEATKQGHIVIYIDAEMGRNDVLDRVADWMNLKPDDLTNLHYCDLPPKLDNVQGASALWHTVETVNPDLVMIDGLNGVVNGAENDDTTWRDMYEWAIAPLKGRGIAVMSADNAGHGDRKGPRGSSVKLDKADAVIVLTRTETGVKLTTTHRRTASYPTEQEYTVTDASEEGPAMKVVRVGAGTGTPAGTKRIVAILDELDAPLDISKRKARAMLRESGHDAPRDVELLAMLRWRRSQAGFFTGGSMVPGTSGNQRNHLQLVVPRSGNHLEETPASEGGSRRGCTKEPPPVGTKNASEPPTVPSDYEDPFA